MRINSEYPMMIGRMLAGRYKIVAAIGGGGFGQTFKAEDIYLPGQPTCVVKQLKPQSICKETIEIAKRLFESEAENLYKLGARHDQIPRLMAHFTEDSEFFLVQEYIEGHTLSREIFPGKQLSEDRVVSILLDVLEVLAFVHQQQVIHRDIKPANLIRRKTDNKVVLIDFGAVKDLGQAGENSSNKTVVIGSLEYMPSEQLAGQPKFCSDIYALGMMCLQALTGLSSMEIPKDSLSNEYSCALAVEHVNIKISEGLAAIIDTMVRYDYRQRYENAAATLQILEQFINNSGAPTVIDLQLQLSQEQFINNSGAPTVIDLQSSPELLTNNSDATKIQKQFLNNLVEIKMSNLQTTYQKFHLEEPEGQIDLDSSFYVERPPIEKDCFEIIIRAGSLIRIKAPRQMGKSSLLSRTLSYAKHRGYKVVHLYLQQADGNVLAELDLFLKWFCGSIASELDLNENLDEYWQGVLGSKNKCTKYFQRYLLTTLKEPLVLGLDEVDLMFQYPKIASDFFGLLRAWHEKAKNEDIWKRLRLVIVHSKEVYIPLNINQSPFNVGLPIELPELNRPQVEDLVRRHQLEWQPAEIEQLMMLTGGHPYLVRQALYQIARGRMNLEQLSQLAATEEGIYGDHLRRQLGNLQEDPELINAFKELIASNRPLQLDSRLAFKLRSIGLVRFQGNHVVPMCDLYRQYFRQSLRVE